MWYFYSGKSINVGGIISAKSAFCQESSFCLWNWHSFTGKKYSFALQAPCIERFIRAIKLQKVVDGLKYTVVLFICAGGRQQMIFGFV